MSRKIHHFLIVEDVDLHAKTVIDSLREKYERPVISEARTAAEARAKLKADSSNLDLIILDLQIPFSEGEPANSDAGKELLKEILKHHGNINIIIRSAYIRKVRSLKNELEDHPGGVGIAEKGIPRENLKEIIEGVSLKFKSLKLIKIKVNHQLSTRQLDILKLMDEKCLSTAAIAKELNLCDRTIRDSIKDMQQKLGINTDKSKNMDLLLLRKAKEKDLI